jgi:hypothetical protein
VIFIENNKIDVHEFVGVIQGRTFYGSGDVRENDMYNF